MKKILLFLLATLLIALTLFAALLFFITPQPKDYETRDASIITAFDEKTVGEVKNKNVTYTLSEEIPQYLKDAVVSVEDKRFYRHFGLDPIGIARAMLVNLTSGEIREGASTITQQCARLMYFDNDVTLIRKLKEAAVAIKLNFTYTKAEVLTIYLNEVYFGAGAYGVWEAAKVYFSCEPQQLSLSQCATLAGIIQAPSAYNPLNDEGLVYAEQRRQKVLSLMLEQGYISAEEFDAAVMEAITPTGTEEAYFLYGTTLPGYEAFCNRAYEQAINMIADYYVKTRDYGSLKAYEKAQELFEGGGVVIKTSLDTAMQNAAIRRVDEITESLNGAEAAVVMLENTTGDVLVYYGGVGYSDTAASAHQPGSTIKPLYLMYGIEHKIYDTNDIVLDEPVEIEGYSPNNHMNVYGGWVSLRQALVDSLNCACLKFFVMAPSAQQVDFVESLGVSSISQEDRGALSFALGGLTYGISPAELCRCYCVIGNGGKRLPISYFKSVSLSDGTVITNNEQRLPYQCGYSRHGHSGAKRLFGIRENRYHR